MGIWVGYATVALLYTFDLSEVLRHTPMWFQAQDAWGPVEAGRYVWYGALGFVYQGTFSYALPLSFIFSAPVAGFIDAHHLVEGIPYPVARPSGWILVAPYTLAYGIPLLVAVRRLTWALGLRRFLWCPQIALLPLVLAPAYFYGHFEDVLALTFLIFSLIRALNGQWPAAAFLLSLAVSSKQWAMMVIPLYAVLASPGTRLRTLLYATALPAALTLIVLGADWSDASRALFSPVTVDQNAPGHVAFFASWLGRRTSQATRTCATAAQVPLAWFLRKVQEPTHLLAGVTLILLVRPLAEPIGYSYYWSPGLLMAGAVSVAAHRRFRPLDWLGPIIAVAWATPRSNPATNGWWWTGEMLLLVIVSVQVSNNCGLIFRVVRWWPLAVKNASPAPILQSMNTTRAMGETPWNR